MNTEEFDYDYYYNRSNENKASLEALRENGHPLLGEYEILLNRQTVYLHLIACHREVSALLGEDHLGMEFNDKMVESIATKLAKDDARIKSLYSRMTRKKADRKAYCRKYYNEHRREIAARHRLYDKSKYKKSPRTEVYVTQYAFHHRERYLLVGKISRFFSFDKASSNEYFASLKRAVQQLSL